MSTDGTKGRAYLFVHRDRKRDDGSTGPAFWIYGVNGSAQTEIWFGPFIGMRWTHQAKDRNYWDGKVQEKLDKGYVRAGELPFAEVVEVLEATKSMLTDSAQAIRPALGDHVRRFLEPSGMFTPQRQERLRRMLELGGLRPIHRLTPRGPAIAVSVQAAADLPDDLDIQVF